MSRALVLEEDATFGADHLFCDPMPYRAIAASSAQVAQISIANLKSWLKQSPRLHERLLQQAQQRQCLIFLKLFTALRSLTSHQLQQLLPYFVEEHVAAGASLEQVTPSDSGRFWLRRGQIESHQESSPLTVGNAWGYPHLIPVEWTAQGELLVYKLPIEHWEAAQAIAPVLSNLSTAQANLGKTTVPSNARLQITSSNGVASQSRPTRPSGRQRPQP